jgi:hypothetical protein
MLKVLRTLWTTIVMLRRGGILEMMYLHDLILRRGGMFRFDN